MDPPGRIWLQDIVKLVKGILSLALLILLAVALMRAVSTLSAGSCVVSEIDIEASTFLTDGASDFGFTVTAHVQGDRENMRATVTALLSTSLGDFRSERTVFLQQGVPEKVVLDFREPDINAADVSALVKCEPQST